MIILNFLSKNVEFSFSCFIRKLNIYNMKIWKNDKESCIELRCSYKLLALSLKNLAKNFNLKPKLIFPYKFSNLKNLFYIGDIPDAEYFNDLDDYAVFRKTIKYSFNFRLYSIKYCKRDCEITKESIKILYNISGKFVRELKISYSTSSFSLNVFIKHFNKNKIKLKISDSLDYLARKSYFGGRCEVFGNPEDGEKILHFDFSGMYSQCMVEKFPLGKMKYIEGGETCKKLNPGLYSIEAYSSSKNHIPVLPSKPFEKKLLFTNGYISTVVTNEELELFLENKSNKLLKINYSLEFDDYGYVFKDFVEYFNKIKERGGAYKTFSKFVINSLYGRLGMKKEEEFSHFCKNNEIRVFFNKYKINSFKTLNDINLLNIGINKKAIEDFSLKNENHISNVIIASFITSKARIKLYRAFRSVEENLGRVLYADTDSIFAAYPYNPINKAHGEVFWDSSKEDTEIKDAVFINPKMYGLVLKNNKEIIKIKGVNNKEYDFNYLKKRFYSDEMSIVLKNNFQIKKSSLILEEDNVLKEACVNNYDKRVFSKNKKYTSAIYNARPS